jgi:hypothetical protein
MAEPRTPSPPPEESGSAEETLVEPSLPSIVRDGRIVVHLKAVGSAPQLKANRCRFKMPATDQFKIVASYV